MKCLICGRTCLPGAKLCADCSSARKRAFAATVTQPLLEAASARRSGKPLLRPSQSVAATARRTAERALLAKPLVETPAGDVVAASQRMDRIFLISAVVAILLVGAFIAYQRHATRAPDLSQSNDQPPAATRTTVSEAPSMVPAQMAPKSVGETQVPPVDVTVPIADVPVPKADANKRGPSRSRANTGEIAPPPPETAPPPPAIAAAPVVAAPPAPREAPPADPMQQMRDALSQCTGGLFDRIVCDQRVRREYCDGRWGQVPQCPSGVPNDRGG